MATTYVGLYGQAALELVLESIRETGAPPEAFREKVRGFVDSLPGTCTLIGSWAGDGKDIPGVMVVEAETWADLQHINSYYGGWLAFSWHPTATGGVSRA